MTSSHVCRVADLRGHARRKKSSASDWLSTHCYLTKRRWLFRKDLRRSVTAYTRTYGPRSTDIWVRRLLPLNLWSNSLASCALAISQRSPIHSQEVGLSPSKQLS